MPANQHNVSEELVLWDASVASRNHAVCSPKRRDDSPWDASFACGSLPWAYLNQTTRPFIGHWPSRDPAGSTGCGALTSRLIRGTRNPSRQAAYRPSATPTSSRRSRRLRAGTNLAVAVLWPSAVYRKEAA